MGFEEMEGYNKDVPLAVNHSNRCGGKTANQNSTNEMRPVWKLSMLYCSREGKDKAKAMGEAGKEALSVYFKQHRKLLSCWPLQSTDAKACVIIFSTVHNSFVKAARIRRKL